MGILAEPLQFIRDLHLAPGFEVCELGDQYITGEGKRRPASEFYAKLGCGRYESIDGNGRGTRLADLNREIANWRWLGNDGKSQPFLSAFDLVTDFGTGEHVFDQAQVWETIHAITKPRGFIVFDRPCAGYEGHCFYLIQPNVIAAIAHANGYDVREFRRVRTSRGELIRGVLRKGKKNTAFVTPQQGRYHKDLGAILTHEQKKRGPDWQETRLCQLGLTGRNPARAEDSHEDYFIDCQDSQEDLI